MILAEMFVNIGAKTAQFEDAVNRVNSRLNSILGVAGQVRAALANMVVLTAIGRAVNSFGELEMRVARIKGALNAMGFEAEVTTSRLQGVAKELAENSLFGQKEILAGMGQAVNFGAAPQELKSLTQTAMGLATVLGTDLATAMRMVERAQQGVFARQLQMIPAIRQAADGQEKWNALLKLGAVGLEEQARMMDTVPGKVSIIRKEIDNIWTGLGEVFAPEFKSIADQVIDGLRVIRGWISSLTPEQRENILVWAEWAAALMAALAVVPIVAGQLRNLLGLFQVIPHALMFVASPLGIVTLALLALGAAFLYVTAQGDTFEQKLQSIGAKFGTFAQLLKREATNLFERLDFGDLGDKLAKQLGLPKLDLPKFDFKQLRENALQNERMPSGLTRRQENLAKMTDEQFAAEQAARKRQVDQANQAKADAARERENAALAVDLAQQSVEARRREFSEAAFKAAAVVREASEPGSAADPFALTHKVQKLQDDFAEKFGDSFLTRVAFGFAKGNTAVVDVAKQAYQGGKFLLTGQNDRLGPDAQRIRAAMREAESAERDLEASKISLEAAQKELKAAQDREAKAKGATFDPRELAAERQAAQIKLKQYEASQRPAEYLGQPEKMQATFSEGSGLWKQLQQAAFKGRDEQMQEERTRLAAEQVRLAEKGNMTLEEIKQGILAQGNNQPLAVVGK